MKKKLITAITLATSIPLILFASVDVGGVDVGTGDSIHANGNIISYDLMAANIMSCNSMYVLGQISGNTIRATRFEMGNYSTVYGYPAASVGKANFVSANNCMAIGLDLDLQTNNSVAVGKYNVNTNGMLFVVGDGTSAERSNALEVWDDGTVIIKKQGDISMGNYTQ